MTYHNLSKRPKYSPLLVMGIGILAVSSGSIFIRFAQQSAPSLVIAAYRMIFASLILLPFALPKHKQEFINLNRKNWLFIFVSGFFLALHFATWITSLEFTSVASSVVFVDSAPIWVALFSPILLKERIPFIAVLGIVLAFLGGAVVGLSDVCEVSLKGLLCPNVESFFTGKATWGNLLALMGAWSAAIYLIMGRIVRTKFSLTAYIFAVYSIAAVVLFIITLFSQQSLIGYPPIAYIWFLLLAIVPQLLGHSSFNYALGFLSAAYVAVLLLGEPIGSTLLAAIFLNEVPSLIKIIGMSLILVGIVYAAKDK